MDKSGDNPNPGTAVGASAQGHALAGDSIVLEEEIDPNYVPTEGEVREYAKWLGMDLEDDRDEDLFWIAKEGLKAPLSENWKPCKTMDTDEIYYFNFATGESTWDHPCDEYYRKLYEEEKKKKLTKDKAKHDKSMLQAKKDMDQLLERNKKRKKKAEGKKNTQKRSPKHQQAVSTALDRKPLPGIRRKPLHSGGSWTSEEAKVVEEKTKSSRTQLNSLVSHRLSKHLSVSAGSDDHEMDGHNEESFGDGSLRHSTDVGLPHSREDMSTTAIGVIKVKSQHEDALKELRTKHAQEVNDMHRAYNDIKRQLEEEHRRHDRGLASQKCQEQEQIAKAKEALRCEQETGECHYRDMDTKEGDFVDSKARFHRLNNETQDETKTERQKAGKAAETEKHDVELGRNTWSEEGLLQEAKLKTIVEDMDQIDHRGVVVHRDGGKEASGTLEYMRVVSELEVERKRVAELESRLKDVKTNVKAPMTDRGSDPPECEDARVRIEKFAELEGKLAIVLRENEDLRSNMARAQDAIQYDQISSEEQGRNEIVYLSGALEEAKARSSKLEKEVEDASTALDVIKEKADKLELINVELSKQIARNRKEAISHDETDGAIRSEDTLATMRKTLEEQETALSRKRLECSKLRAESKRFFEEVQESKRREAVIHNDLKSAQKSQHETELQNEELKGIIETVRQEKESKASTEATHIREVEAEVQKLKNYLAGIEKSRDGLKKEVRDLEQKLVASEDASRTERATFEAKSINQKDHVESLQATIKVLESELETAKRKEAEQQNSHSTSQREHKATSISQDELSEECDRAHAEERLELCCNHELTLETHGNDGDKCHDERVTRSFIEKEYQSTASQTLTGSMIHCDDEPNPPWSEEMEQAKASIASRDMEIIDWTARANEALEDAQRSKNLASQLQEEINTLNKRHQGILEEFDKERKNLQHAEEECRRANAAANEAKAKLLEAEQKQPYREVQELKASLRDTSARVSRTEEHDKKSPGDALHRASPPGLPDSMISKSGGGSSISRDLESSMCSTSDVTNQDLADELMHKLLEETSRRRSDKTSRSWNKKLEEEKRVLGLVRQMMKHQKQRVKRRQQKILQYQACWRDHQSQQSRFRHPARHRSLEEAKLELDREVLELNAHVRQLRHNKIWLDRRERKIFDFEKLLRKQKPWPKSQNNNRSGSSSLESTDVTSPNLRSLEALQQELGNDLSDLYPGSEVHQVLGTLRQKRSQVRQFPASRGKENTCPTLRRGRSRYQTFFPFPEVSSVGKLDHSSGSASRCRSQECNRRSKACGGGNRPSNSRTLWHDLSMSLEGEHQHWLTCKVSDPRGCRLADRERTTHLIKLKEEGKQAQSTVALHVDWLNSLKQEMGLLGSYGVESSRSRKVCAASVVDISPVVDALISPRRVVNARKLASQGHVADLCL